MNKFIEAAKSFVRREDGTEIVEWAIVGGLVVAAGATVFVLIGGDAGSALGTLRTHTQAASGGG